MQEVCGTNVLWLQGGACSGNSCTEPEFPHHDLALGTVFATPTTLGLPNEVPPGMTKRRIERCGRP